MRNSIEPRERRYVKGYGFISFAKNFNDKYGKSLRNASKTFAKTAGKEYIKIKITAKPLLMEYQKKDIFILKKNKKLLMN